MTREEEAAFVRGFAAAAAQIVRHQTMVEDLLRSAGLTEAVMKRSKVDDFDLELLAPIARKMAAKDRRRT